MVRTKEDTQAAPTKHKPKGTMHNANVAAARAKAALKKKAKDKGQSNEDNKLERSKGKNSDDSPSSSESQHAEKLDTIKRAHNKSKSLPRNILQR